MEKKNTTPSPFSSPDSQRQEGPWGTAPRTAQVLPPPCPPLSEPPGCLSRCPGLTLPPSWEPVALLRAPAAPCPAPGAFPAGSPYLAVLCRPSPGAQRLLPARAGLQQRPGGKLEDENARGRRDLRPRNCLARFVLYKGGEYPRELSAHAFPHSWKLVTLHWQGCFCWDFFLFPSPFSFFIVHTVKSTPSQVGHSTGLQFLSFPLKWDPFGYPIYKYVQAVGHGSS